MIGRCNATCQREFSIFSFNYFLWIFCQSNAVFCMFSNTFQTLTPHNSKTNSDIQNRLWHVALHVFKKLCGDFHTNPIHCCWNILYSLRPSARKAQSEEKANWRFWFHITLKKGTENLADDIFLAKYIDWMIFYQKSCS